MAVTHLAVGGGAAVAQDALTTLLTGVNGMDAPHAESAALLIVMVVGGVLALATQIARAKWPNVFNTKAS
jgi:hypothetical protein